MNRFGYKKKRLKNGQRKVAAILKNIYHHVPDSQLPAMWSCRSRVEVATPKPLFPYHHDQRTLYRIKL